RDPQGPETLGPQGDENEYGQGDDVDEKLARFDSRIAMPPRGECKGRDYACRDTDRADDALVAAAESQRIAAGQGQQRPVENGAHRSGDRTMPGMIRSTFSGNDSKLGEARRGRAIGPVAESDRTKARHLALGIGKRGVTANDGAA